MKSDLTKAKNLLEKCRDRNHQWQERCEKITEKSLIDSSQGKDEKEIIKEWVEEQLEFGSPTEEYKNKLLRISNVMGGGLGGIFGQPDTVYRTKRGVEKTLFQLTIALVVLFIIISVMTLRLS